MTDVEFETRMQQLIFAKLTGMFSPDYLAGYADGASHARYCRGAEDLAGSAKHGRGYRDGLAGAVPMPGRA